MAETIERSKKPYVFGCCCACKQDFAFRKPKLLPCLHTLCDECLKPREPDIRRSLTNESKNTINEGSENIAEGHDKVSEENASDNDPRKDDTPSISEKSENPIKAKETSAEKEDHSTEKEMESSADGVNPPATEKEESLNIEDKSNDVMSVTESSEKLDTSQSEMEKNESSVTSGNSEKMDTAQSDKRECEKNADSVEKMDTTQLERGESESNHASDISDKKDMRESEKAESESRHTVTTSENVITTESEKGENGSRSDTIVSEKKDSSHSERVENTNSVSDSSEKKDNANDNTTDKKESLTVREQINETGEECDQTLKKKEDLHTETAENKDQAVNRNKIDPNVISCPICKCKWDRKDLLDNMFVQAPVKCETKSEDGGATEEKYEVCTACDETQKATSFCIDCQEWLCDQCVFAHKRVRITKDHTISTKITPESVNDVPAARPKRHIFCELHKTEKVKLFCLTCDKLTCRDCQLLEHKDHKYQFINETISEQKITLQSFVDKVKSQIEQFNNLGTKISSKENDIKKQQRAVFNDVRQVADSVTNEIISWCKKLLNFLSGVCNSRMSILLEKRKELHEFSSHAKHCVGFVESALEDGDDLSILYTKSLMMKNLDKLLKKEIEVQDKVFELTMKYKHDASFLTKNVSKMGSVEVNGLCFPSSQQSDGTPALNQVNPAQVAEWLNQYPPAVRERYLSLPVPERKVFLQGLLKYQMKKQIERGQGTKSSTTDRNPQPHQQQQQKQQPHMMDSTALQDHYKSSVRTSGTFYPQNKNYLGTSGPMMHPNMMPLQPQNVPPHPQNISQHPQNISPHQPNASRYMNPMNPSVSRPPPMYNWQGQGTMAVPASRPVIQPSLPPQRQYTFHHNSFGSFAGGRPSVPVSAAQHISSNSNNNASAQFQRFRTRPDYNTSPGPQGASGYNPGAPSPVGAGADQSASYLLSSLSANVSASGNQSNPAMLSIEPINIKEEPKDNGTFSSCAFSNKQKTNGSLGVVSPHQVEPSITRGPPPLLKASDHSIHSRSNGSRTVSPNMPDVQLIDDDRSQAMKELNHPSMQSFNMYNLDVQHDPNDPSEDYCAVCHNGGDLLCCDRCPKVFHFQCHIPVVTNSPSSQSYLFSRDHWFCTLCIPDAELKIMEPIADNSFIPGTGKRKAPIGLVERETKCCERILLELFCHTSSSIFHEPVNKAVPNYYKIITSPMDFSSIKHKLRREHFNHYNTVEEFLTDLKLVFKNCFTYNAIGTEIYDVGKTVEGLFEHLVQRFIPCYYYILQQRDSPAPGSDISDGSGSERPRTKRRKSPQLDLDYEPQHIH